MTTTIVAVLVLIAITGVIIYLMAFHIYAT